MSSEVRASQPAMQSLGWFLIAGVAFLVVGAATMKVLGLADPGDYESLMLAHGAGGIAFCLVAAFLPPAPRRGSFAATWRAPLWYAAFLVAWAPFALWVYPTLLQWFGRPFDPQPQLVWFTTADRQRWQFIGAVATAVVIMPLVEEIAFRGHCRDLLRASLGPRLGWLVTALLFGLVHGLVYALPITLLGLFFGWLRERYDSLWAPFVAHSLHNGLTVALVSSWPQVLDDLYR